LLDFVPGRTYFINLEEKNSNKYQYFIEEDDDYVLVTVAGLEKQIYVGMDIPIYYGNITHTMQPMIFDIVDDLKFLLGDE
jgi:hypothetical protein